MGHSRRVASLLASVVTFGVRFELEGHSRPICGCLQHTVHRQHWLWSRCKFSALCHATAPSFLVPSADVADYAYPHTLQVVESLTGLTLAEVCVRGCVLLFASPSAVL